MSYLENTINYCNNFNSIKKRASQKKGGKDKNQNKLLK